MRTIRLTEFETSTEHLSDRELGQVLAARLVRVTPRTDGLYDLRADSKVGTVVMDGLRLLIRPKIGLSNLFFLLSYGSGLTSWSDEAFPYEEDDFFAAVAWLLEAEVRRASRYGLVRDYREREESLATLRGRHDLGAQMRRRQGGSFPLECRFQEHGEDIELNRVIKAAIHRLLHAPAVDPDVLEQLRHHRRSFAAVGDADYPTSTVPDVDINRLNEAWATSFFLARLILQADSVRDAVGTVHAIAFTVDMNKLFERFVEQVVGDEVRRGGLHLVSQARRRLTASVPIRPDLIIQRAGLDVAVGDAKYKELAPADWPHADLYQLLAYCVSLRLDRGLLIYAEARKPRSEVVDAAGIRLEILGIDLAQPHREVLNATRKAAARLVRHAKTQQTRELAAA